MFRKYPIAVRIFYHESEPNAVNLFNRLKEDAGTLIDFNENLITLNGVTEHELLYNLNIIASTRI